MSQVIEIKNNYAETIGSIRFDESGEYLGIRRTATGFNITIPAYISLRLVAKDGPMPMVNGIWGYIFATDRSKTTVQVGHFRDSQSYKSAYWINKPEGETNKQMNLTWEGSFAEIAVSERIREGRPPQLYIQLWGEICYLIPSAQERYYYRSEPVAMYGDVYITYPKEIWVSRLRSLGVLENVLVEIPLPCSPPAPWDGVWQCLIDARNAYEQGGTTGWKACATEIRLGLERWNRIEPVATGPANLQARTKQERLDQIRTDLYSLSNFWVHNSAANCSRNDAVLMLSTFSALLAERNP